MKKKPLLITCALLLAAVPAVLFGGKNQMQRAYVFEVNSAAKYVYNFTQTMLIDMDAGLLDYTYSDGLCFHAEEPLHDGIYRAEYDPKAGTLTYRTADGETAAMTDGCWKMSDKKLYFIMDIREGSAMQVCACRSNTLTEADLVPAGRGIIHTDTAELTLAGYWLDRYIGYLNYDYTPQSAETA